MPNKNIQNSSTKISTSEVIKKVTKKLFFRLSYGIDKIAIKKPLYFSLFLGLILPSVAIANFIDVYNNNPHYQAINYVQQKNLVSGYPNGTFKPENLINRAEFVKILIKAKFSENEIKQCLSTTFRDIKTTEWYANYVCLAQKKKLIDGYPDGTFKPSNNISFVEAAKILRNTFLSNDQLVNSPSFKNWYEPYVNVLSAHRAIPVSIYSFNALLTREQMAEIIYRLDAKLEVLPSLSIWEISDRSIIEDYYNKISSGKYEEAYNLKVEPEISLEKFKETYKNFPISGITNFTKIAAHTYEFSVITYPHLLEGNKDERSERYKVKMQVIDSKLKTLSSTKETQALLEEVNGGNKSASLEWEDGVYKIYIYEKAKKTLAASYDTKDGISLSIKNLNFSPNGKYLTYQIHNWEFAGVLLYDIENNTVLENPLPGTSFYNFSGEDKNFYFCSESGMSSGEIAIINFPGLNNLEKIPTDPNTITSCGPYDSVNNILHYQLQQPDGNIKEISYQFIN